MVWPATVLKWGHFLEEWSLPLLTVWLFVVSADPPFIPTVSSPSDTSNFDVDESDFRPNVSIWLGCHGSQQLLWGWLFSFLRSLLSQNPATVRKKRLFFTFLLAETWLSLLLHRNLSHQPPTPPSQGITCHLWASHSPGTGKQEVKRTTANDWWKCCVELE